jgi:hypothetical protein
MGYTEIKIGDLRCDPRFHNRGFTSQICDYYCGKEYVFQERSRFPPPFSFKDRPKYYYWITQATFLEETDAVQCLTQFGFDPKTWTIQESFYGPGYFLITTSFEDALRFVNEAKKRFEWENMKATTLLLDQIDKE